MDPPRHACRGRPIVCPGPCNPLKAHHHHHHRHHHHRQKSDTTRVAVPERDVPLPDEFSQITELRSLETDTSVATATLADDASISRISSSTKIILIKIPKISHKGTDVPATLRQILSPERLAGTLGEPSKPRAEKSESAALLRKIEPPIPTRTMSHSKETAASTPAAPYRAPRNLNDVRAIMTKLNGLAPKGTLTLFLCLTILLIYAGIHVLLAVIAWQTPAYQYFVSSQICGVLAFLMWRLTGTILIWAARIDNTSR